MTTREWLQAETEAEEQQAQLVDRSSTTAEGTESGRPDMRVKATADHQAEMDCHRRAPKSAQAHRTWNTLLVATAHVLAKLRITQRDCSDSTMGKTINTTVGTVLEGVELCEENVKRFLTNAEILLDHHGSEGVAYILWSLAVEEFGKAVLLRDQVDGRRRDMAVDIELTVNHTDKFTAGFNQLPELTGTRLGRFLRVTGNSSPDQISLEDPLQRDAVTIAPMSTGLYEDVNAGGVDPTVSLRFHLLYVDWDSTKGRWVRLDETFRGSGVTARWELSSDDLRQAIEVLRHRVENRTT